MPLPRLTALVIGVVYLALGVLGFVLAPDPTATVGHQPSNTVWIFSVGWVQNFLHTVLGLLGVVAAGNATRSRLFCLVAFFVLAGMTAYGVVATIMGHEGDAALNTNWADNILHALTAAVAVTVAMSSRVRQPD